ncbi:ATP-binding protein [Kitasatospora xanthocidica]|uniref:ATP-binding protein n=1 Tax=Kitasatospora xanthocidica TaxID=83382 RepID=A0A372ZSF0_9ACTN|nr:ATP-binding protein [Kitasatospora xanthocidica]RGD58454.1 ATP-binding protein [Kitasatospora xanthocidica]
MVDSTSNSADRVHGTVVQTGSIGVLNMGGSQPPAVPEGADEWVRAAAESRAWKHVREDRDAEPYRCVALKAVGELARLRDETVLAEDPWQDPGIAVRFASRVDWLLGDDRLDLYPAEAALMAVLPFLYRVRSLRLASARASVRPTELSASPAPNADRAAYEQFFESYDLLVGRTRTRPASAVSLGWWLFHRWLDQHEDLADPDGVQEIVDQLPMLADLGETFALKRVCALLHGLRRGPDVGNRDYLASLSADDHLRAPGEQHVREPRLALLLALAYGTAIEMAALPEIVAEHLGIPHEVDLTGLRRTLDEAVWGGSYDLPVLRAECHHEAVVEGLREYTARADELLHAVRRVLTTHPLPTRLTSDEAAPAAGAFTGWARFRIDERRVRSLLMGVELYRDRDLAVRELYQNALDACRYRRARTEYLDRTKPRASYTYNGRIAFCQGVDEDGRAYLECQDNGVGMGEEELRGVFSNAGARFAEQLDFKLEQAEWRKADPPVEFHPNSRFGIGVLSYFMLADEIRVTTCRMDASDQLGPKLEVSIYGPSHLFRIARRSEQGEKPGTTVRLYLREDLDLGDSWSALDVLERLLGIAEFRTKAVHGERSVEWVPKKLRTRQASSVEETGLNAFGVIVPWENAPDGAQVMWCEHGGALLVDGLFVQPSTKGEILGPGRKLTGVVVNLSGTWSPTKLSVDRRLIIDDVSPELSHLLRSAAAELAQTDSTLLSMEWLAAVIDENVKIADIIAAECVRQERRFEYRGCEFETRWTGCCPMDVDLFCAVGDSASGNSGRWSRVDGVPDDSVVLWRLMAHDRQDRLVALAEFWPALTTAGRSRVAMPSDQFSMALHEPGRRRWSVGPAAADLPAGGRSVTVAALVTAADRRARSVAEEAADWLRGGSNVPQAVLDLALAVESDRLFLKGTEEGRFLRAWPEPGEVLAPGYLAKVSATLGVPISEVADAMAAYGLEADLVGLPDLPSGDVAEMLSHHLDGLGPWLSRSETVPVAHVLRVANVTGNRIAEVLGTFTRFGFLIPWIPQDATVDDLVLFDGARGVESPAGVEYEYAFSLLGSEGITLEELVDRYRAYGSPMFLPGAANRLDWELFQPVGALNWDGLVMGDTVPFARLITAARRLHRSPEELARHLNSRGIAVSCDGLPQGLTHRQALEIVGERSDLIGRGEWLATLLEVSQRTGRPIAQLVDWYREWGIAVPDVAESIRDALARVPMADPS